MEHYRPDDTIAAISTPLGRSGIGVVRLSGAKALDIASSIFISKNNKSLESFKSHTIHYGFIKDNNSKRDDFIDEVLLTVMKAPKTYTREDIVEINCHGGVVVLGQILNLCINRGARAASPGEFTLRAYLNGRIDLSQAEAVMNIIDAKTEEYLRVSARQLDGGLSKVIFKIREELLLVASEFEAILDFPEEEVEESKKGDLLKKLKNIKKELEDLIKHGKEGSLMREGIKGVIVGRPNVGKSSLMNALLGHNRVIVNHLPGTTRDVVEEVIDLDGIPLRVADTAGIIETDDLIEREGVRRANNEIERADLVLVVLDSTQELSKDDHLILDKVKDKHVIIVVNKIDLKDGLDLSTVRKLDYNNIVKISAIKELGIDELRKSVFKLFLEESIDLSAPIITNIRHLEGVKKALEALNRAIDSIMTQDVYFELITEDLRLSLGSLSSILGIEVTKDLLETIFSRFCIGK
ncbi:MAG: tRNA uridine-5-carboxymethylaminomethyl(34) synthesis GTPase MnmE [Candidatus Kaelpia aquatica]|nr:tRNA uridine-5-carboxymethylaminomethyl(34) synthesis GTPase MnmE [Candidatus Kaelpia aquatica]